MRNLLKTTRSAAVTLGITLTTAFLPGPNSGLFAQPQLTDAQILALRPAATGTIPAFGTFWSVARPSYPPYWYDPFPDLPAYRLPDGSWLVDDSTVTLPPPPPANAAAAARSLLNRQTLAAQRSLAASALNQASSLDLLDPTNSTPETFYPPQLLPPPPPTNGTFWFLVNSNYPPLPYYPFTEQCDVYLLSDGSYLVDDSSINWTNYAAQGASSGGGAQSSAQSSYSTNDLWLEIARVTNSVAYLILHGTASGTAYTILSRQSWATNDEWDAEQPLVGADGQDWTPIQVSTLGRRLLFFRAAVGTVLPHRLRLRSMGIANNTFNVVLQGTTENVNYDILSTTVLHSTNSWAMETNFTGAAGRYWTPVSVPMLGRPNLFLSARSWVDSNGSGIPDWWQLQYLGDTNADSYADPDGDGWSNLREYQNATNPNHFDTPSAPQGLTVKYTGAGMPVTISWNPSPGLVTGYTLERDVPALSEYDLIPNLTQTLFLDSFDFPSPTPTGWTSSYRVQAHYGQYGDSPWSEPVPLYRTDTALDAIVVRGPQGRGYLIAPAIPRDVVTVRVCGLYLSSPILFEVDLPAASFTNGISQLPEIWDPFGQGSYVDLWLIQTVDANGIPSTSTWSDGGDLDFIPFFDGRPHLANNLAFLLRHPRQQTLLYWVPSSGTSLGYRAVNTPAVYACAGLHRPSVSASPPYFASLEELKPFQDNYLYRNLVFAATNVDATGFLTTGAYYDPRESNGPVLGSLRLFTFSPPDIVGPIPDMLSPDQAQWTYNWPFGRTDLAGDLSAIGIHGNIQNGYAMDTVTSNYFGLSYVSAKLAYASGGGVQFDTLYAGGSITGQTGYLYAATAQPILSTVDYYFCRPGTDPFPGHAHFCPTNTTPLMLAAVGRPFNVAGYAKQLILNGDHTKWAYLGQYFDKTYRADAGGAVTTNETGVLSDYGDFLPTEPGLALLTTKPDLTQTDNVQGQCPVHVISLQTDVDHSGIMDLSFAGPDNSSQARPLLMWVDNDFDRYVLDSDGVNFYDDGVQTADCPFTPNRPTPNCNYRDGAGNRLIPCARDLQNFARLWVCGVTTNLLAQLPPGTTITLDWGDVGNPNPANPTIDLFQAAEPDGGTGYLTNSTIAGEQVDSLFSPYIGRLGPGQSIQLNASRFANGWAGNYFIWCGVSNGTGGLTMTISQGGTNTLAQTTTYIQLVDIKQMYERWTVGDQPSKPPTNTAYLAQEGLPLMTMPFQYGPSTDPNTPYVLYVHGWNMKQWEKDRFAETAFKRLYWQGYQGRFGVFRWPTDNGFGAVGESWSNPLTDPHNYDNSEFTAWKAATGLANKLTDLSAAYPGHVYLLAHSMGNVVAGEALRLLGSNQIVNTYIASQAAIPAHVYDATVTNLIDFTHKNPSYPFSPANFGPTTPNIYGDRLAGNNAAVGRRINFYNFNDFALSPDVWCFDQELKPDTFVSGYYTYLGSTNDPAPWNHFEFIPVGSGPLALDIVNNLQDRYEALAYAAEPRSRALGSTAGVTTMDGSLSLPTVWPTDTSGHNYADHFWHSAQFRGDCWQEWNYWHTLLRSSTQGFNISN